MQFTALIHHNFRNVHRIDQKVLLTSIINEHKHLFRDHFWADYKQVVNFIPKNNLTTHLIMFEADIKPYSQDPSKQMLSNIYNITILDTTINFKHKKATCRVQ